MRERPNVLLILADDMGFSDIGCYGSEIETPHLNRLAGEGLRFSQMYNVARCCPSRACLLTGLYPHAAGIGHMTNHLGAAEYQGYLNESCITIAEALKHAGYQTAMAGKWHVGGKYSVGENMSLAGQAGYPTPRQRGFDRFFGILEGAGSYYNPHTLMENETPIYLAPQDDFYLTEAIGKHACDMLDTFAANDSPWFLYTAFTAPHWPLHARQKDIDHYRNVYTCGWDEVRRKRYERLVDMKMIRDIWEISPRDSGAPAWKNAENKALEAEKMAVYAAQVTALDREIGHILTKLEELGIADNTLTIFLSDNGGCAEELPTTGWIQELAPPYTLDDVPVAMGNDAPVHPGGPDSYMSYGLPWANASNTPFRLFKHWIQEGGISTPCIIHWKNGVKRAGEIEHESAHFVDILPTVLEATQSIMPREYKGVPRLALQGESICASFTGRWHRKAPIFWEHEGNCGVREGRYKLVRKYPGPFELYDMENDRTELHDLAKQKPKQVAQMAKQYQVWANKTGVRNWDTFKKE